MSLSPRLFVVLGLVLFPACSVNDPDTQEASDRPSSPPRPVTEHANGAADTHASGAAETPANGADTPANGADTPANGAAETPANDGAETPAKGAAETPVHEHGCPAGMVRVDAFCIDRYEAHLVTRGPAGEIVRHPHNERPEEGVSYEARSEAGVFPQAYVSRVEAESACAGSRKRLCTRREWQRACKGTMNNTYPYGARHEAGRCNTEKPHLLTLRFGADNRRWTYASFNDPALDTEPGFLARTGVYSECATEDGVLDMVGNLHEWVSDVADGRFRAHLDSEGIPRAFQYWSPGNGVFMGGFYSTQGELGPGCAFTTIAHEPRYHDYSTGFRCCDDPE
ncbi:MAG: SUMF1/EgtB/PvdO family nonheme iron enzyme [Polyangiaceae bacterium]